MHKSQNQKGIWPLSQHPELFKQINFSTYYWAGGSREKYIRDANRVHWKSLGSYIRCNY